MGQNISITADDGGTFNGYLAVPASGKGPGVVVGQEIFGVNANIREVADQLAKAGYVALAPDLFWRMQPNIELGYDQAGFKKAIDYMNRFDQDQGIDDIAATMDALHKRDEVTGEGLGFVGYCLGGRLAYLAECRTDLAVSVGYYGVNIEQNLEESKNIHGRLVLHFAEQDQYATPDKLAQIFPVLEKLPKVELYRYPNVDHAFARFDPNHYKEAEAKLAWQRTLAALKAELG